MCPIVAHVEQQQHSDKEGGSNTAQQQSANPSKQANAEQKGCNLPKQSNDPSLAVPNTPEHWSNLKHAVKVSADGHLLVQLRALGQAAGPPHVVKPAHSKGMQQGDCGYTLVQSNGYMQLGEEQCSNFSSAADLHSFNCSLLVE